MGSAYLGSSARGTRVIPHRTIERGLSQENDWCIPRLVEEKLCPKPVSVEQKPHPSWIAVTHRPEHRQADQLIEVIVGINEVCDAWLRILSQDPCGFW